MKEFFSNGTVKEEYSSKKSFYYCCSLVQIGTYVLLIRTSAADELSGCANIDDLEQH